jgi:hypothetical protein
VGFLPVPAETLLQQDSSPLPQFGPGLPFPISHIAPSTSRGQSQSSRYPPPLLVLTFAASPAPTRQLDQEIHRLKFEDGGGVSALPAQAAPPAPPVSSVTQADGEFVAPRSAVISASGNKGGNGSTPAPAASNGSNGGIFLRSSSSGAIGAASERLVLRSSDGRPRVMLTPAEREAAKVTAEDLESVRSLH